MIDRPPAQEPSPAETWTPEQPPEPPPPPASRGPRIGAVKIAVVLVLIALIGSAAYVLYVVTQVKDEQIPLLGAGFGVMGASFAVIALGSLYGIWRAATRARGRRAFGMAILGGIAGLLAIACLTFTAVALLLDRS